MSKIAARFGVSRSTLLYYDSINLLKPSARNEAGYRLYSDADVERLRKILLFRKAGVSLGEIANLLHAENLEVTALLLKRMGELNKEIEAVKKQQAVIIKLLENSMLYKNLKNLDECTWLAILNSAGISRKTSDEWHSEFEKHSPLQHQLFLELLGFNEEEILNQRERYRAFDKR
ncbi:MerR family transcriptional regulator [Paenibacillus riograndensis]|uniref:MerR family transcriptional regulator n=1 Tax=Paenibacillus riograndensis TaxID=483937 RepID=UPI001428BD04|nr:MerR family transcriptional regulator [Paenibacillus riograndensis]